MTVPVDLTARVALHTQAHIDSLQAEFPAQTKITEQSGPAGNHVYEFAFPKLGENLVAINHDNGKKTYLENFAIYSLSVGGEQ